MAEQLRAVWKVCWLTLLEKETVNVPQQSSGSE